MPTASHAQATDSISWFREEWQRAAAWRAPQPTLLTYEAVAPAETIAAAFRARESQVAAMTEDQRQAAAQSLEEDRQVVARGNGFHAQYRLWFAEDSYRWSYDSNDRPSTPWRDSARRGSEGWSLTPQAVNISVVDRASEGGRDAGIFGPGERERDLWLRGGLGILQDLPSGPRPLRCERWPDGKWVGEAKNSIGAIWEFRGTVSDDALHQPLVEEIRIIAPDGVPGLSGDDPDSFLFTGWTFEAVVDRWVPETIEWRHEGRVHEKWTRHSIERVGAEEFVSLISVPTIDSPDPIRGDLRVKYVNDYRPGVEESTRIENGRAVEKWRTEPSPRALDRQRFGWLLSVGWGLAALLGAGLLVLLWRRIVSRRHA
ncbi:MAG: hypothetical protein IPJ41_05550 [Phycisphaerales bacterium]|nr:hypothetical protein [Phycisphaerales bacterium]